jgi:hypothetical protein
VSRIGNRHIHYRGRGYIITGWGVPAYTYQSYYYGPASTYYGSHHSYPFYTYDNQIYDDNVNDESQDDYYFRQSKKKKTRGRRQ